MNKKTNTNYKEVKLDSKGKGINRFYKNPLTRTFQYEYALYLTVSDLFASVCCRSMCIDSLRLYFSELPSKNQNDGDSETYVERDKENNKKTQESVLAEVLALVSRDVIGHIDFPMINICAAEVSTLPEDDGTHSFIFTDGVYGFKIRLDMKKGHPSRIMVEDLHHTGETSIMSLVENATLQSAA